MVRWTRKNIENIYYITGILGIVTIIITAFNYHNTVKHNKFSTSMKVIKTFQYEILPVFQKDQQAFNQNKKTESYVFVDFYYRIYLRLNKNKHKSLLSRSEISKFVLNNYKKNIINQAKLDTYSNVFNNLEEVAIYIEKDMVLKSLVFREIGDELLEGYLIMKSVINVPENYYAYMSYRRVASKWLYRRKFLIVRNRIFNYIERKL